MATTPRIEETPPIRPMVIVVWVGSAIKQSTASATVVVVSESRREAVVTVGAAVGAAVGASITTEAPGGGDGPPQLAACSIPTPRLVVADKPTATTHMSI